MRKKIKIPPKAIRSWVERHFPDFKERKGGDELVIHNPLYGDGSNLNKKFGICVEGSKSGSCNDWRSNSWAGEANPKTGKRPCHIVRFAQLYLGVSYNDALKDILGNSSAIYTTIYHSAEEIKENPEFATFEIPEHFGILDGPSNFNKSRCWNYLLSRGYSEEEILKEKIMSSGTDILWVYTELGETVYAQSRSIRSKNFWFPPKEIVENGIKKKYEISREDVLYGFDDVPKSKYLIIVESIFNKNSLGKHAVASCGASISDGQISRIKMLRPQEGVILAADADLAGLESILKNGKSLKKNGFKVFWSIPPQIEIDGQKTNDWNDLYTKANMNKKEIAATFNKRIIPLNKMSEMKIKMSISKERAKK